MTRERLPNKRQSMTATAAWPPDGGNRIHLSVGLNALGQIREIFARAARPESGIDLIVDDVSVLLSLLLQHGVSLKQITHSLGRLSDGSC